MVPLKSETLPAFAPVPTGTKTMFGIVCPTRTERFDAFGTGVPAG